MNRSPTEKAPLPIDPPAETLAAVMSSVKTEPESGGVAPPSPSRASAELSLTQATSRGFAWLLAQTVGTKCVALLGQFALAWLVHGKGQWGNVGLALSVAGLATLIQSGGLIGILVQRGSRIGRWSTAAFWLAVTTGVVASVFLACAAPLAAVVYHSPELQTLVLILACGPVFDGLAVVPQALLQVQLRFRDIGTVQFVGSTLMQLISVILAWRGFGSYSFIIPVPLVAAVRAALFWWMARPKIRRRPQLRRWRYILGDSGLMLATSLFGYLMSQGDYIALGLFHDPQVLDPYFFAFMFSLQTVTLLTQSLTGALFPALSRLKSEPARQAQAFIRATKIMALVAVPACLLQAALAGPILRILFHDKWVSAIPMLRVLSVGMALSLVGAAASNLIVAQGRFVTLFRWSAISAVCFMAAVITAANQGQGLAVAVAVSAFYAVFGPVGVYIAIRTAEGSWREVAQIYLLPLTLSLVAIAPAALAPKLAPLLARNDYLYVAWAGLVAVAIYLPLARLAAPRQAEEIVSRIHDLWTAVRARLGRAA
jgi:PST family polysaccharide transporter